MEADDSNEVDARWLQVQRHPLERQTCFGMDWYARLGTQSRRCRRSDAAMADGWGWMGNGREMAMAMWVSGAWAGWMEDGWLEGDAGFALTRADTRASKQAEAELASQQRLVFFAGRCWRADDTSDTRSGRLHIVVSMCVYKYLYSRVRSPSSALLSRGRLIITFISWIAVNSSAMLFVTRRVANCWRCWQSRMRLHVQRSMRLASSSASLPHRALHPPAPPATLTRFCM